MTPSAWRIEYAPRARRDLRSLDPQVRARVAHAIGRLADDDPRADVRKLTRSGEYRLRTGDWRVRFERDADGRRIVIQRVLPRGRVYDR